MTEIKLNSFRGKTMATIFKKILDNIILEGNFNLVDR